MNDSQPRNSQKAKRRRKGSGVWIRYNACTGNQNNVTSNKHFLQYIHFLSVYRYFNLHSLLNTQSIGSSIDHNPSIPTMSRIKMMVHVEREYLYTAVKGEENNTTGETGFNFHQIME